MSFDFECFFGMVWALMMIGFGLFLFRCVGMIFEHQAEKAREYQEIRRLRQEDFVKQLKICDKLKNEYRFGEFEIDREAEIRYIKAGGNDLHFIGKSLQDEARRRLWAAGHVPNDYALGCLPFCSGRIITLDKDIQY